jgi:hypothetical protein
MHLGSTTDRHNCHAVYSSPLSNGLWLQGAPHNTTVTLAIKTPDLIKLVGPSEQQISQVPRQPEEVRFELEAKAVGTALVTLSARNEAGHNASTFLRIPINAQQSEVLLVTAGAINAIAAGAVAPEVRSRCKVPKTQCKHMVVVRI